MHFKNQIYLFNAIELSLCKYKLQPLKAENHLDNMKEDKRVFKQNLTFLATEYLVVTELERFSFVEVRNQERNVVTCCWDLNSDNILHLSACQILTRNLAESVEMFL